MARIRTIKPEFFRHEVLFEAEAQSGLPLRLAFISLWTVVDREGRFKWRPRALKLDCLPYDDIDFSRVLDALETRGFVVKYEVAGEIYGVIPTFAKHQVVNNREAKSELPDPCGNNILTRQARVNDATVTPLAPAQGEGKGREQEGELEKESNSSSLRSDGADAAPDPMDENPKDVLFSNCLQWLMKVNSSSERSTRSLIGKWLSELGGDSHAGILLGIIRDTRRERKADPVGWIAAMVSGRASARAGPAPQKRNPDAVAAARILGENRDYEASVDPNPAINASPAIAGFDPEPRVFPHEGRSKGERSIGDLIGSLPICRRA